jgi:hypothetical protein
VCRKQGTYRRPSNLRLRGVGRRVRGWLGRTSCRISKSGDGAGLGRQAEFRLQKYKSSVAAWRTELSCFQGSVETGRRARDFATVAVTKVWCAEYGALWLEPHEPKRTVLFPAAASTPSRQQQACWGPRPAAAWYRAKRRALRHDSSRGLILDRCHANSRRDGDSGLRQHGTARRAGLYFRGLKQQCGSCYRTPASAGLQAVRSG